MLNFVLSLEDRFSPATKASSKALKELQNELTASKSKLSLYQQQLSHSKQLGDVEGYRKYSKLVEDARKETFRLGEAMVSGQGASTGFLESIAALPPIVGQLAAAVGVASIAIAAGFTAVVAEGVNTALEVSEVNERLTATFNALGSQGPESGKKTLAMLDKLASTLPQTREQLAEWVKTYEAMGVTDLSEIRSELRATASAQAIMGNEGAEAYTTLRRKVQEAIEAHHGLKTSEKSLQALYKAGVDVTKIASAMELSTDQLVKGLKAGTINAQQFGDALRNTLIQEGKEPLKAMGNELGVLEKKAGEAFGHLFDGIDTSPITDAIKGLIDLGNQANPSGKALKAGIGEGIQGVIDWLGKMGHEAKIMFLELELFAVKNKHTIKDIENAFKLAGDAVLGVVHGMEQLVDLAGKVHLRDVLGSVAPLAGVAVSAADAVRAPGHAEGGMVHRPAAGEFFASVAPGEMILPQRQARELAGPSWEQRGLGGAAFQPSASASGGVRIDHLELTIQAPQGVTDAHAISATGLSLALERYQLGSGR
jgi:hypothetical protein